jgi:hypothetical protein
MTMAITGPAAADYSFAATGTQSYSTSVTPGVPLIPGIHFTPTRTGLRTATLTITNTLNGSQRSYTLAASGSARIRYIGNIAEGGTPGMVDGDSLMLNVSVLRRQQASFRPMTVENFNFVPNFSSAPVPVTVTIDSAGTFSYQYKLIHPVTGALVDTYTKLVAPGDTFSPRIMFRANSAGKQVARMVVTNPDNENRVFYLAATSSAPAGRFEITGQSVIGSVQFTSVTSCVGEAATVFPMVITNTGFGDLVVSGFDVYRTDTTYRQGTPTVALVRDGSLNVVPSGAYGLFSGPVTVPLSSNPSAMPIVVPQGQSRTVLLSFIPNGPGKRWARVFMRTNAQNFNGYDTAMTPNVVEGMVNFDLVGTGIGSQLAANTSGLRLRTTVFPSTRVGDSVDVSIPIANSGACDLRINRGKLRIFSGDVNEFRLLTSLQTARIDATTGDYVLAPNTVDTLRVRFRPSRAGTRLATIWIQTNDSTIHLPGLTERGAYYLDLHGRGLAGLDGTELVLSPVAIGGSVDGVARLENSMNIAVGIDRIFFDGGDATEFTSVNWPTPPSVVLPGQKLLLGVRLSPPVGTQAGIRRTTIVIVTSSGDTVRVPVRGEAGTQTLVVSPTSLFDNISIAVGQASRQTLMISNTGTLPVRINRIEITGVDSAAYRLGMMPRRDLEPGQTEYVEVTFVPTTIGQTTAQIEVDASNGQSYTVTLGGTALRIRRDPVDDRPTHTIPGQKDTPARRDDRRPGLR